MNGGFWCVVGEERLVRSWRCDWKRGGGVFICGKGEGGWEEVYLIVGVRLFLFYRLGSRCWK